MNSNTGMNLVPSTYTSALRRGLTRENAVIRVINGPLKGRAFPLSQMRILIGRNDPPYISVDIDLEPCELPPLPFKVSRRHGELLWLNESLYLLDVGSLNGTFVNGLRIKAIPNNLKDNDVDIMFYAMALMPGDRVLFANIETEVSTDD